MTNQFEIRIIKTGKFTQLENSRAIGKKFISCLFRVYFVFISLAY
jgi:hypothetical protein